MHKNTRNNVKFDPAIIAAAIYVLLFSYVSNFVTAASSHATGDNRPVIVTDQEQLKKAMSVSRNQSLQEMSFLKYHKCKDTGEGKTGSQT